MPETTDTKPLTRREIDALTDLARWEATSPYIWKQGSMTKLEARGLVRRSGRIYGGQPAWQLTPEGRKHV